MHSVFARAVNVSLDGGRLFALQGPGRLAAPFAASLDGDLDSRIEPGATVTRFGSELRIGCVEIDSGGAEVVSTAIAHGLDARPLAAALLMDRLPAPAPALGTPTAVRAQRLLARGLRTADTAAIAAGAYPLIGLGEGLTPAGDDYLVGVLAVVRRLRPDLLRDRRDIAAGLAHAANSRTTAIAREFLLHALDGGFSELVVDAVSAASPECARSALRCLIATGATSGADTAAGMCLALAALAR